MLKIVSLAASVVVVSAALVIGADSFLAPDDLRQCAGPDLTSSRCSPAEAIIVISGGDTFARTQEAIQLYKDGWAPILVFSGAALDQSGPSNAKVMHKQALDAGVPSSVILLDENASDTTQNAVNSRKLLPGAKRLIVVTSPYHQRRAGLEFTHQFGEDVTILNHPTSTDRNWTMGWWTTPGGWWLTASETVKTVIVMFQK